MSDSLAIPVSRKWVAARSPRAARTIWQQITKAQRVRREQWEQVLALATDSLTAISVAADDEWTRNHAERALIEIQARSSRWS